MQLDNSSRPIIIVLVWRFVRPIVNGVAAIVRGQRYAMADTRDHILVSSAYVQYYETCLVLTGL